VRLPVRGRVYRPAVRAEPTPALLWIHGGGLVSGTARMDEATCADFARELGIVVLSVDYRLAPEYPYPTPLDDCYAALAWLHAQPGVDHDRIAVGGASAGGGLAAALAQLALDRGQFPVAFQLLTYPMLDDRSAVAPARPSDRDHRLWNRASNRVGWSAYLGTAPGSPGLTSPPFLRDATICRAWLPPGLALEAPTCSMARALTMPLAYGQQGCPASSASSAGHSTGSISWLPRHLSPRTSAFNVVRHYARLFASRDDELHALDVCRSLEPDWFRIRACSSAPPSSTGCLFSACPLRTPPSTEESI